MKVFHGNIDEPVLNNVSFEIAKNSINIIAGKEGSGKSGIFDLLLKMNRPVRGNISIGDTNILDTVDDDYFSKISLASQYPSFFNTSIKDNFMLFGNDFNKVVETCQKLGIHDYITSLKDGYDTNINTKDITLSHNFILMANIARILIKNTPIMLIDETISLLDSASKTLVLNIISELKINHTIVIISNEQDVIDIADNIINLEKGKII